MVDKAIKEKWLEALRSGKYKQTRGALRRPAKNNSDWPGGYCCLGVLCKVVAPKVKWQNFGNSFRFIDDTAVPPRQVMSKLNLTEKEEHFYWELPSKNDGGMSFNEIADLIERRL
jgi:hypothetical protein